MTLQEIREIKEQNPTLKIDKRLTGMFNTKHWAAVFSFEILYHDEVAWISKFCDQHHLIMFIGRSGIHIQ